MKTICGADCGECKMRRESTDAESRFVTGALPQNTFGSAEGERMMRSKWGLAELNVLSCSVGVPEVLYEFPGSFA